MTARLHESYRHLEDSVAERTQDCVGKRVCRDVGIRMAAQSGRMLDFDAAQDELASRLQRVKVEALPNSVSHLQTSVRFGARRPKLTLATLTLATRQSKLS